MSYNDHDRLRNTGKVMQKASVYSATIRMTALFALAASYLAVFPRTGLAAASDEEIKKQDARLSQCAQDYPEQARRQGRTGTTRVQISVDAEGNAIDVIVLKNSGSSKEHRQLDRAAVTLFKCMSPYKKTGQAYAFESEYVWRLD
jgi:TonB family protein